METGRFWLLVGDAARARIFVGAGPTATLTEVRDFVSPLSRTAERDHVTDRPGRQSDEGSGHLSGQSPHSSAHETHHKEHAAETFAYAIADFINHARGEGRFEALTIVAAPAFLGMLRPKLSPATAASVLEELDKDLSKLPLTEIQSHLTRLA